MNEGRKRLELFLKPSHEKLVLVVAVIIIWIILGLLFLFYGYERTWLLWNIQSLSPFFLDLRLIPGTIETMRMGLDPTVSNPGDPNGRIFNYPWIWYLLFYTGISQNDVLWMGILLIVLFFVGAILFPDKLRKNDVVLILLVLFSPAAMLLYERANVDLLIFFLCALAVSFSDISLVSSNLVLLFASILKLFPFFGMSILLHHKKQVFLWLFIPSLLIFVFYIYLTFHNVQASWDLTQRGLDISYGASVLVSHFKQVIRLVFKHKQEKDRVVSIIYLASYVLALLMTLIPFWFGVRRKEKLSVSSPRNLNAFWMGASIFVGTFLLGNNWDYRLVFLVFVIPQVLEWFRSAEGSRHFALFTIVLILLSCWYIFYNQFIFGIPHDYVFVFDEIVDWMLFAAFSFLLGASAPEWLKSLFTLPSKPAG